MELSTNSNLPQKTKFLSVFAGKQFTAPPIWLMRQAGRYLPEYRAVRAEAGSFLNLCYNPQRAMEVTLQPIRRFGFDAAIIFSDILVIPHALGQQLDFVEGEGPKLSPIRTTEQFQRLDLQSALTKLEPVFEAISKTSSALGSATPLIGFCGAPWTVASYMVEGGGSTDQRAAKLLAYRDSSLFEAMIGMLVEASAAYLIQQVNAGAKVLQIFDSWAGSLSDDDFEAYVIAPTIDLVKRVKAIHPLIPIIGFPRGSAAHYSDYIEKTGVDAIGCDTAAPLHLIAEAQKYVPTQGNLDPLLLLAGGDAMERRVKTILDTLSGRPFIFNLGHGIVPETPIEHVTRLVEIVRNS